MKVAFCSPDIPRQYGIQKFKRRCRNCGYEFDRLTSYRADLARFEEIGGEEVKWLPTFGRSGLLDILERLLPGAQREDIMSYFENYRFFDGLLQNYIEPNPGGNIFKSGGGFDRRCPSCRSKDLVTSEPILLENPPIQWMRIACVLFGKERLPDDDVYPYWLGELQEMGSYSEAEEELMVALGSLLELVKECIDTVDIYDYFSSRVGVLRAEGFSSDEGTKTLVEVRDMAIGILGSLRDRLFKPKANSRISEREVEKQKHELATSIYHSAVWCLSRVDKDKYETIEKEVWEEITRPIPYLFEENPKLEPGTRTKLKLPFLCMAKTYTITGGEISKVDQSAGFATVMTNIKREMEFPLGCLEKVPNNMHTGPEYHDYIFRLMDEE